ncbi:MAG TPA: hypothetical protein VJN18_17090 [Polyangiaceae bacterium]|nr:hypothetical protein [Polyangiaceae bacterium]
MKPRARRSGSTETFSVSVDPKTKRALRALANHEYGGNLSALVTDFAEDARRRMAAGAYLRRHRIAPITRAEAAEIQAEIEVEAAAWKKRRRKKRVA